MLNERDLNENKYMLANGLGNGAEYDQQNAQEISDMQNYGSKGRKSPKRSRAVNIVGSDEDSSKSLQPLSLKFSP